MGGIINNITQTCDGKEAHFSNVITDFGDNLFRDCTDSGPTLDWDDVTTGSGSVPFIWFTAGTGTSGTGASDPAAASDYQMASELSDFASSGGPKYSAYIDAYDESTSTDEFIVFYTLDRVSSLTATISEIGIYMATGNSIWSGGATNRPPKVYDTADTDEAPYRPFLVVRAVIPVENRITKAPGNQIRWRWAIKFTG